MESVKISRQVLYSFYYALSSLLIKETNYSPLGEET